MKKVTGIGGIFFKSENPEQLYQWYEKHLGVKREPHGSVSFIWRDESNSNSSGMTVWALFPKDTRYFGAGKQTLMVNYRVENLDALLQQLKEEGVEIDPKREDYDYGRFAWIVDPVGNRIELWEPPKGS